MRRVIGEAHRVQRWRVVGLGHPRTNLLAPSRTRTTAISKPKHRAVGTGPEAVKGRWKAAVARFFRQSAVRTSKPIAAVTDQASDLSQMTRVLDRQMFEL